MPIHAYVKQHFCFKSIVSSHLKQCNSSLASAAVPSPVRTIERHASLDRLPFEICVEIFSHCPSAFPRIDSQVPPLTLALVCKTWYYLVMNTPRLWSCFELVVEGKGSSQSEEDEMKKRLMLWLRRSRQQPLSFRIIHDAPGTTLDLRSAELLKILLPHASRWQHVYFHGPGRSLAPLQNQRHEGSLRTLRSLSLRLGKPWAHDFDMSRFDIPWSQLSALNLQFYQDHVHSLDECFRILSAAKNLTTCTLNAEYRFSPPDTGKLELPFLRSLKLIIQGTDPIGMAETSFLSFLERLSLTNLRAISVEWLINSTQGGTGSQWRMVHTRLTNFIQSSASSLEHLGLAYLPLRDYEIIKCLEGLSRLRHFDLKFALTSQQPDPITDTLLQHLTPAHSLSTSQRGERKTVPNLPELRELNLQCSGEYLNQVLLLALVEGRAAQGLKEFGVFTLKSLPKEFRDRIGAWQDRGLHFSACTLNVR
ncbi:hypothetical protein D9756_000967 [Leucocoprinus leucothites]|uniref:F-box domain-containing protein n=1 Tax=Leucocoprinus leucothites TaxID=201217 RepID=A0A8H5GFR5_9AGAR|nr:hypothetical protein D9756_000967 [Leucoagaricus leucothites]